MQRKNNKKGFTLAELLIVVAIIAVLVAIAVPLFVGGLNSAQDATFQANKRAVKSAAVVKILAENDGDGAVGLDKIFVAGKKVSATATVNEKGDISDLTINYNLETVEETKDYTAWKAASGAITVEIALVDFEKVNITEGAGGVISSKK